MLLVDILPYSSALFLLVASLSVRAELASCPPASSCRAPCLLNLVSTSLSVCVEGYGEHAHTD